MHCSVSVVGSYQLCGFILGREGKDIGLVHLWGWQVSIFEKLPGLAIFIPGTLGDAIWDMTLIGTVSEKAVLCFNNMMLLLHMVL